MSFKNLLKTSALKEDVELRPHQERFANREGSAMVAAHGVGSGKTLSGIARHERLLANNKSKGALVVVPAGLRENYGASGVEKFTDSSYRIIGNKEEIRKGLYGKPDPEADYNIISYEMFRKNPQQYLSETGADTIITDESHRSKNEGTATLESLKSLKGQYNNYIGLTGSLISNSIADVVPIVDVASQGNHDLGKNKNEFASRYLKRHKGREYAHLNDNRKPVIGFNNPQKLKAEVSKYVDYLSEDDLKEIANMPDKRMNVVKVPLTNDQARVYKKMLKDNPEIRKLIIQKRLETLKDDEAAKAFSQLIEMRKYMNDISTIDKNMSKAESSRLTPKTKLLLDNMESHLSKTPDGQAILLSHLINGGVDVMEAGLKERNIPYGKFIGKGRDGVTEETRQSDIDEYNDRKKKVMLISAAGGEGLSLNDTTFVGTLDPHYNPEKMKQMEARGIRSGGLSHRPDYEREVLVNRYLSTMPKTMGIFKSQYKTPDEVIYEIAMNKQKQNKLFYDLLKQELEDK